MRYAINYALQVRVIEIFLHWNRVILKQKFNTLIKVDIKQKLFFFTFTKRNDRIFCRV